MTIRGLLLAALLPTAVSGCASTQAEQRLTRCRERVEGLEQVYADAARAVGKQAIAAELSAEELELYHELEAALRESFTDEELRIIYRNGALVVRLPNEVLFEFGKAELTPQGAGVVARLAEALKTTTAHDFVVAGHTDSIPVHPRNRTYQNNWELSALRARTVARALAARGVQPRRLMQAAYGEHHPTADNATASGRAANRRTEVLIVPRRDLIPEVARVP